VEGNERRILEFISIRKLCSPPSLVEQDHLLPHLRWAAVGYGLHHCHVARAEERVREIASRHGGRREELYWKTGRKKRRAVGNLEKSRRGRSIGDEIHGIISKQYHYYNTPL
jgi:hypothetical protein